MYNILIYIYYIHSNKCSLMGVLFWSKVINIIILLYYYGRDGPYRRFIFFGFRFRVLIICASYVQGPTHYRGLLYYYTGTQWIYMEWTEYRVPIIHCEMLSPRLSSTQARVGILDEFDPQILVELCVIWCTN